MSWVSHVTSIRGIFPTVENSCAIYSIPVSIEYIFVDVSVISRRCDGNGQRKGSATGVPWVGFRGREKGNLTNQIKTVFDKVKGESEIEQARGMLCYHAGKIE